MRRSFKSIAALMGLMALASPQQIHATTGTTKTINRDAVRHDVKQIRTVRERDDFGGFGNGRNPFKHYSAPKDNQRKYRKWLRQNPHMRNSKKCKL